MRYNKISHPFNMIFSAIKYVLLFLHFFRKVFLLIENNPVWPINKIL